MSVGDAEKAGAEMMVWKMRNQTSARYTLPVFTGRRHGPKNTGG